MSVVVVGAGVVGLSTAYRLARAGREVTVVDAAAPGAAATHGNAAKIAVAESGPVPAPGVLLQGIRWLFKRDSPLSIRPTPSPGFVKFMLTMARHCNERDFRAGLEVHLALAADANDLLDDYTRDGVDFEMHSRGVLLAFETRDRFVEHCATLPVYEGFGLVPERLDADGVRTREPALGDRIRHGLHFSADRQLEPDSLTRGLLARLDQLGVAVRTHSPVESIERDTSGRATAVVLAGGERIDADAVVLAAGVWSGRLSAQLGHRLPIHAGKGYSLDYRPAPVPLRTSLTLEDARVAVTPLDGMIRLAGTMQFGTYDEKVSRARVAGIRRAAQEAFPDWGTPPGEGTPWAGLRPMTPDGLPIIGRHPRTPNAYVASGHGMLGLTLAMATAEIITDLITQDTTRIAPDVARAVSPARFDRRAARAGR